MKNLLFTLFLICICFIESKGEIENNNSFNDERTLSTDSVWETILNVWDYELSEEQVKFMIDFRSRVDSIWTDEDGDWMNMYYTNSRFDTVLVQEWNVVQDRIGYQLLFYTEE